MHEQSDAHDVRERIMTLPVVVSMDAHERAALARELEEKSLHTLERKLDELSDR